MRVIKINLKLFSFYIIRNFIIHQTIEGQFGQTQYDFLVEHKESEIIKFASKNIKMIEQQHAYPNEQQHEQKNQPSLQPSLMSTFRFPNSLKIGIQPPTLNKIQSGVNSFFCAYSNGMILEYTYASLQNQFAHSFPQYKDIYYPYQNCDVIDMEIFSKEALLVCTHTEVTLLNLVKNKRICLRGHEQTPIAVSSHPISPLVVSVSNLIIQHDLRMQKPILVNYITPPVYDIKFFPDGQFYFLSGEPCRIGKDMWMRTLQNGIGSVSSNSKFIVTNDMNQKITLWDWRKSEKIREIQDVVNEQTYQPVHFSSRSGLDSQILFLEDNGSLLHHNILTNQTRRHKVIEPHKLDNWKCQISSESENTKHLVLYEHMKTQIKCFQLKEN